MSEQLNHVIVTESCENLRTLARQALKGKWKQAFLAVLAYSGCLIAASAVAPIFSEIFVGVFQLGVAIFFITVFRKGDSSVHQVFSGFAFFGRALFTYFMINVFVFLWILPVLVAGVITLSFAELMDTPANDLSGGAVFWMVLWCVAMIVVAVWVYLRFSQAFYLMADDKTKKTMQCLRESKEMMKGNKGKFVLLHISFIGWYLLLAMALMVMIIILGPLISLLDTDSPFETVGLVLFFIFIVLVIIAMGAGSFLIEAYMHTARIAFYDILSGRLQPIQNMPGRYEEAPQDASNDSLDETLKGNEVYRKHQHMPEVAQASPRRTYKGPDLD